MAGMSLKNIVRNPNRRWYLIGEIFLHTMVWLYVFVAPLFFRHNDDSFDWIRYFNGIKMPISVGIVFYVNYLLLVPRYVFNKRYKEFVCWNLILICSVVALNELLHTLLQPLNASMHHHHGFADKANFGSDALDHETMRHAHHAHRTMRKMPPPLFFVISNFLLSICGAGLAITVRFSGKWRESQLALQRAEQERAEAELNNLKNQINPHFLLNTLNNIYALTAFDPEGARLAIEELSKMLRYVLYENSESRVELRREVDFILNYVALMRLRLRGDVEVTTEMQIPADEHFEIAPLILISLVENAFKHGISPTHPSYVHILLVANKETITFRCINTNHPKPQTDKSPGGIGLKQVESRLKLAYPDKHTWHYGVNDQNEYVSEIVFTN